MIYLKTIEMVDYTVSIYDTFVDYDAMVAYARHYFPQYIKLHYIENWED